MSCRVLRCPEPVDHVHTLPEEALTISLGFCAAHWARVEGGERWQTDHQQGEVAGQLAVLMGDDLPPLFEEVRLRQAHGGDRPYLEATLVLRGADGDELVTFAIPDGKADELAGQLRFFPRRDAGS